MKLLGILLLLVAVCTARHYKGYQVIDVGPFESDEHRHLVNDLVDDDERIREVIKLNEYDVKSQPISLAVSPKMITKLMDILLDNGIQFKVIDTDLEKTFVKTKVENAKIRTRIMKNIRDDPTLFDHEAYLRYDEQVAWVEAAAAASSIASTFTLGQSYEGRDIIGMTINAGTSLPGIWIDSNIHAREWISSATVLYIIDQILTGTSTDAQYLRDNYRWYFVPNLNPDGYEYTWTDDRMWRKTRSPNSGSVCTGTDPNRNWDANWGGEGASHSPCSDTYCGSGPFSEAETSAASSYIQSISGHTNVFLSIHCYSNLWLVPWGGSASKPSDYDELMRVGNAAAAAIESVNGLSFTVGTPPDILYVASGGSFDWAKETAGIQYAYSPELRPASAIQGGFDIPPSNIILSGAEIFAAVVATVRESATKV